MNIFWTALLAVSLLAPVSHGAEDFLPNWMGQLSEVLAEQTFLDLTLPGTHDTATYDLSETISAGGIDDKAWLSGVLNHFGKLPGISHFIQKQAQTQVLTVSEQLDAGIRFLDFRVMYTGGDWRCLHMLQSNQKSMTYLQEVRVWLDAHPTEIVAMWLSKHGSECATGNDQYPGVSKDTKQAFWKQIQGVFNGLLLDTSKSTLNGTGISDLVKRNHRVIIFASDFVEFTGGKTTLATDGCLVDNPLSMSDVYQEDLAQDLEAFAGFAASRLADKRSGKFLLSSMANSPPSAAVEDAALYNITGMTQWCPERLLDVSQLTNYYKQLTIDAAYDAGYDFPNAIYLDAVTHGGLIRTGTRPLSHDTAVVCDIYQWTSCHTHQPSCHEGWTANGEYEHWDCYDYDGHKNGFCGWPNQDHYKCCRDEDGKHATDAYAYADTLIAVNVRRACGAAPNPSQQCLNATSMLSERRARFPKKVWSDPPTGRLSDWPKAKVSVEVLV